MDLSALRIIAFLHGKGLVRKDSVAGGRADDGTGQTTIKTDKVKTMPSLRTARGE